MRSTSTLILASILLLLFGLSNGSFAQAVGPTWTTTFGSPGRFMYGPKSAVDAAGNLYVAASIHAYTPQSDFLLCKYNSSGVLQWSVTFDGVSHNQDVVSAIAVDASGNIIVTGNSMYLMGTSEVGAISTVKYNGSGSLLWATTTLAGIDNQVWAMTIDATGDIYLTGRVSVSTPFVEDMLVVKLDANGAQLWQYVYNGTANGFDEGDAIALDVTGNVYVTGRSQGQIAVRSVKGQPPGIVSTGYDFATLKIDANGNRLWLARYNSSNLDIPSAIAVDAAANVYVTGMANNGGTTVAYNTNGVQMWAINNYGSQNNTAITVDPGGNVETAGYIISNNQNLYYLAKYSASGVLQWQKTIGGGINVVAANVALAVDNQSGVYMSFPSNVTGGNTPVGYNYLTLKYATDGTFDWSGTYDDPQGLGDVPFNIICYPAGISTYTYVVGISNMTTTTSGGDLTALRYTEYSAIQRPPPIIFFRDSTNSVDGQGSMFLSATSLGNFPNPFHGSTQIVYTIDHDSHVLLQVFDLQGNTMATLANEQQVAGRHAVNFSAGRFAAGIYTYRIVASSGQANHTETKQMILQ